VKFICSVVLIFFIYGCHSESADDTYADLDRTGPLIRIEGNQGYSGYKLMEWEDGTIIDARKAAWKSYLYCTAPRDSTCNDSAKNPYPIQLGADWRGAYPVRLDLYNYGNCPPPQKTTIYWLGGIIEGTAPLNATWREIKASNGAGITLNALNSTIDGVRMYNLHDPILPLEGNNFVIKNCWISYARDDAIENDAFASGLIDDCLFDGCFVFYSARNPKKNSGPQPVAPGGGAEGLVKIHHCLIRMQVQPGGDTRYDRSVMAYQNVWKENDQRQPRIELVKNIFLLEKPHPGVRKMKTNVVPGILTEAQGNIVIWLGEGDYPHPLPDGFEVLTGEKGLSYWQKAKHQWIQNHPKVPRLAGDPKI
jgi:hypothetical protein